MASEIERFLALHRAETWTKADTEKVAAELKRCNLLIWDGIGKRWPYTMACDFYRSHHPDNVTTRQESTRGIQHLAKKWAVNDEFVYCLLALGFMAQDTVSQGFAMAVALSNSVVVREPFNIIVSMGIATPFWTPRHIWTPDEGSA